MALTPENVINKGFKFTKYTKGYSMEEVDDFLDEVVVEFRRLNAENASLKRQLEEAENQLSQASASENEMLEAEVVEDSTPVKASETVVQNTESVVAEPEVAPVSTARPDNATSLLAMAQKVHDEYVAAGKAEKERMIGEARKEANTMLSDARTERNRMLADLDQTKKQLENSVDSLRTFEKQYRQGLREFMEANLKELNSTPNIEAQKVSTSQVADAV